MSYRELQKKTEQKNNENDSNVPPKQENHLFIPNKSTDANEKSRKNSTNQKRYRESRVYF